MTISAYRIVSSRYRRSAFDSKGAKRYGGRWNSTGISCVYVSESESSALLETLVHLQDVALLRTFTIFEVNIPEALVARLPAEALPPGWRAGIPEDLTTSIGDKWLLEGSAGLALRVPSVLVPREFNYLLNVNHPSFVQITAGATELNFA